MINASRNNNYQVKNSYFIWLFIFLSTGLAIFLMLPFPISLGVFLVAFFLFNLIRSDGFTGAETGWWGTNIYLHNTLHVVGHIHFVILMGSMLLAFGLIYSIVPAVTGKNLNSNLGTVHLILTVIGGFGLAFLFTNLGFEGFVRREAIVPDQFT